MQRHVVGARLEKMTKAPNPLKVLVVDDDREILDFMQTFLTGEGCEVETLSDPSSAESAVRAKSFHMVVLDLMMPDMDGVQVLERIRKVDDDIAVVIFTGYPSLETAVQSMKLDAIDYLKKPFNPQAFRDVIARVMQKKGLLRSPEEELHRTIGAIIRSNRKEQSLTLKQMARRTGLSVSLLSQIERAESSASISSLYKIARALDVRVRELFGDF